MHQLKATVFGRVQMVMFRDFAQRKAKGLKLTGTVRNNEDKTVTVIAEGQKEALEKYVAKLHQGPPLARVERVEVEWQPATDSFTSFDILYD